MSHQSTPPGAPGDERQATLHVSLPEHQPLHTGPLTRPGSEWLLPALPDAVTGTLTLELASREGAVVELTPAR